MCAPFDGLKNPFNPFGAGFSLISCNRKCLLAYAGNGLRGKPKFKIEDVMSQNACGIFYSRIGDSYLTNKKMDDFVTLINAG